MQEVLASSVEMPDHDDQWETSEDYISYIE